MVLLLLKLGTLALRTLSKPVANRLKHQAAVHPRFPQFIIDIAQMYRRIYNHATVVEIRPLNEEKAVQAAVDLIGELFVFTVAGALLIFEVQRSARSEARKEEPVMRHRNEALALEVDLLKNRLQALEQLAMGRGLGGVPNFRQVNAENANTTKAA